MNNSDLELLLTQYIQGELSSQDFRSRRKKFIHQFIEINSKDDTLPVSNDTTQNIKPIVVEPETLDIPTLKKGSQSSNYFKLIGITGLIALAVLAIMYGNSSITTVKQSESSTETLQQSIVTEPFIKEFNLVDNWDSESLSDFLLSWQALSLDQQAQARKSDGFKTVKENLLLQLRQTEQENLDDTNVASRKGKLLNWFAEQLAIEI